MNYKEILDTNYTIGKDLFKKYAQIWEVLPNIKNFILELGPNLDNKKYQKIGEDIWISNNATIDDSAKIIGPCIIDDNAIIRNNAYIRGSVIIGKNSIIGNSCEIKKSIIFDNVQIPHFNYVGDSIIGNNSHLGAGVILTNLRLDKKNILINNKDTGLRKMGAIIGSNVDIGANSVIYPGSIIGNNTTIYPLVRIGGIIENNSLIIDNKIIIKKEEK